MRNKNLVDVLDGLKEYDHKFLVHCINSYSDNEQVNVHLGSLPFVSKALAKNAVEFYKSQLPVKNTDRAQKQVKRVLNVLQAGWDENNVTFQMKLNSTKVRSVLRNKVGFNLYEVKLPIMTEVECGIKWKEFGKVYERDKQQVSCIATAHELRPGFWEITCSKVGYESARNWFFSRCG